MTEKPTESYLELVSFDASWILRHQGTGDARKEKVRMRMQRCIFVWTKQSPGPIWTSKTDQHYNIGRTLLRESMSNFQEFSMLWHVSKK